jgi:hypothetical protein
VDIQADFYWKFVNEGVNGWLINRGAPNWGTQPNSGKDWHTATVEWMAHRGITPKNEGETVEQVAWNIMRAKARDGQEARPFFTDVVNQKLISYLQEPIERVIGRAIEIRIVEPWR